jgi:hypothetical protein
LRDTARSKILWLALGECEIQSGKLYCGHEQSTVSPPAGQTMAICTF